MTFDKSRDVVPYLLATAIGIAAVAPYLEFDGRLILEPDVHVGTVRIYYDALAARSLTPLTVPGVNVYFEGHCLVYALALHAFNFVRGLISAGAAPIVAAFDEHALVVIRCVNALARVLATTVFFATVRRLTGRLPASLLLTFLFACSPQIFAMDLERIDHFMILPLVVILHISVVIAAAEANVRHGAVLGAALALIMSTKLSGFLFGGFPALAMAVALAVHRRQPDIWKRQARVVAGALAAGLPLLALFMIRYVLHWPLFWELVTLGYREQMTWTAVFNFTPRFYYNIDLFAENGWFFLAVTAAAAALVLADAVLRRAPVSIWLVASLMAYSAAGAFAFKYDRGGYHLVPLYLYVIGLAFRIVDRWSALRPVKERRAVAAALLLVLLVPVTVAAAAYSRSADIALKRAESIALTRLAARDWMTAHFTPGMRICLLGSSQ
ncbi:MAG: glycosyltransferase family 39 protein [Rhodospirillaceae bacterium]